jgi:hypothetical protein
VHERVPDAEHDVEPLADDRGKVRPQAALQRDVQVLAPEAGRRHRHHRVASIGGPYPVAPAGERRRIMAGAAGRVQHGAGVAGLLQQPRRRGVVDRGPAGQRVVVEQPVVIGREGLVVVRHDRSLPGGGPG